MKRISVITPCYNEQQNVEELYRRVRSAIQSAGDYPYEHIFIDNHSSDRTVAILRELAAHDPAVKVIVNTRNFGHIRSPYHALLQTTGDAVIGLAADLQEPPELIPEMLRQWQQGSLMVLCIRTSSSENKRMYALRSTYYRLLERLSSVRLHRHFTGFGLYDRKVVNALRTLPDAYPYFRGMVAELGFAHTEIEFVQPTRERGVSKNNFLTLYDTAMLGITTLSKAPLRLIMLFGVVTAVFSVLIAFACLAEKLLYWDQFSAGIAPLVIALFFLGAVQLIALGIIGEYIGAIHTQALRRPLVMELERINFDDGQPAGNPGDDIASSLRHQDKRQRG